MKKVISIAILLMLAASAQAAVTVSCTQVGGAGAKTIDVSYNVNDVNSVRAFALDISVSSGTISSVSLRQAAYYIYPGSIQITGGSVTNYGTCVCTSGLGGALGGTGTSGVTIEMGSLYTGTNKPATSGVLARLTVSTLPATVTIAQNTARGGVVMERPEETPVVTLSSCGILPTCPPCECFPSSYTSYNDWKALGKPDCWCGTNTNGMTTVPPVPWPYQCDGDADNKSQTLGQSYRIYTNDFAKLLSCWRKKATSPGMSDCACADFDRKSQTLGQSYRIYTNDYNILLSNWRKKASQLPGNCPRGI